ncbi:hypothetical protein [Gluconobacter kondonii]|uniref:hypothetical protein n=1 Tax=Gluconobacter kondonii TaxID=941463 RepID=UPI001B8BDFAB|nr:hypothetical protein [Gluconobacter kondonii]MBS1082336.1 hypothetical protein [Gluconobacter kondonii]
MEVAIARVDTPMTDFAVTPFFRHETVEDVMASQREKRAVMKTIEVCELRIAGEKNYVPVVPADSIWQIQDGQPVTYAERFADQYRQFKMGGSQEASGTPLQELSPYGITPAQISLCRAMKIHSIEAIHSLEGAGLKALGVQGNELKRMAAAYMANLVRSGQVENEVDDLRRKIAELTAMLKGAQAMEDIAEAVAVEAVDEAIEASEFAALSDEQIKSYIRERTGTTPRGNPSRETLLRMAAEA